MNMIIDLNYLFISLISSIKIKRKINRIYNFIKINEIHKIKKKEIN